jgi:hypothetical protein
MARNLWGEEVIAAIDIATKIKKKFSSEHNFRVSPGPGLSKSFIAYDKCGDVKTISNNPKGVYAIWNKQDLVYVGASAYCIRDRISRFLAEIRRNEFYGQRVDRHPAGVRWKGLYGEGGSLKDFKFNYITESGIDDLFEGGTRRNTDITVFNIESALRNSLAVWPVLNKPR